MELLSPAGSIEKLSYAYAYGADAAYIGVKEFSLRARADGVEEGTADRLKQLKGDKKLYGAVNRFFHEEDYRSFASSLEELKDYPFDAFIVSDLGPARALREAFGDKASLHLSTQANCLNSGAIAAYKDLGFSRIILGREASLDDIRRIKDTHPDMEIEAFVHGAMCMAYSGRCFLSAFLTGRSANEGDCSHTCRWKYRTLEKREVASTPYVLEEESRPGEYFPVIEKDGYSTIMSSKDLCMIDHLQELKDSGVDSLKIEGRMKSLYYVATVTRAYRKAIDVLEKGYDKDEAQRYIDELHRVSHREYSTGFFFSKENIEKPTDISYIQNYLLIGTVEEKVSPTRYRISLKNKIVKGTMIEFIGPDILSVADDSFTLWDAAGNEIDEGNHQMEIYLETSVVISEGYIIRKQL
ncbi:MAG: U32 family peptidase C-terminal domain-containing protein [Sphaerochaetaceae bacterium]|nr:U32 family peptidase C-terminal domain-containing protein [Sphaerochaetaceae bacterium]